MANVRRSSLILASVILVALLAGVGYVVLSASDWVKDRYKKPLEYIVEPQPVLDPVCPGDTISYEFTSNILEEAVPLALTISRGVWSLKQGQFVIASRDDPTYPYVRPAIVNRTSVYAIPQLADNGKPLPPGAYLLMVVGESELRDSVGFEIAFRIADACAQPESSELP